MTVLLRLYQLTLSRLWPGCCIFYPSCSHYAVDALRKHPIWRALPLIAWRLMRCQPFCRGGYDPVPEPGERSGRNRP